MTDFVHLVGAEDVRRAGSDMREAADRISQAVSYFGEHVARMEAVTREATEAMDRLGDRLARARAEGETDGK